MGKKKCIVSCLEKIFLTIQIVNRIMKNMINFSSVKK